MNTAIEVSHVAIDGHGRAWIDDTNVKVIEVVRDHLAYWHLIPLFLACEKSVPC